MKKLLYLLIPIIVISTCYYNKYKDDIPFDSDKWKNWVEQEHNFNMRKNMIHSLESNHDLVGMSKQKIIDLLGDDSSSYNENFHYFIGYGMGISTSHMDIIFDTNDIVTAITYYES